MTSQWIDVAATSGGKYGAYLSLPPAGKGPGLVLFQVVQFALLGRGRTLDTVIAGGAGVVAQIAVDLVAIPAIGIVGAAYGMWAFTFVGFPTMLWMAVRRRVMPGRIVRELSLAAAVLPLGLIVVTLLRNGHA